jgi:uncharacterized protein (UPF0332 family)
MEQAEEALRSAGILYEAEAVRETVNRAYYAMFYAVLALLAAERKETSKHKGAISLFDLEFVKTGVLTKQFSEWLHEAFDLRLDADYAPFYRPSPEDVERVLQNARDFVTAIKSRLSDILLNEP